MQFQQSLILALIAQQTAFAAPVDTAAAAASASDSNEISDKKFKWGKIGKGVGVAANGALLMSLFGGSTKRDTVDSTDSTDEVSDKKLKFGKVGSKVGKGLGVATNGAVLASILPGLLGSSSTAKRDTVDSTDSTDEVSDKKINFGKIGSKAGKGLGFATNGAVLANTLPSLFGSSSTAKRDTVDSTDSTDEVSDKKINFGKIGSKAGKALGFATNGAVLANTLPSLFGSSSTAKRDTVNSTDSTNEVSDKKINFGKIGKGLGFATNGAVLASILPGLFGSSSTTSSTAKRDLNAEDGEDLTEEDEEDSTEEAKRDLTAIDDETLTAELFKRGLIVEGESLL